MVSLHVSNIVLSLLIFILNFIELNASRQVTLKCGSDQTTQRGLPGSPGKRGPEGKIGAPGPKEKRGLKSDPSQCYDVCVDALNTISFLENNLNALNKCVHRCVNGRCVNENNIYVCLCSTGYAGINCTDETESTDEETTVSVTKSATERKTEPFTHESTQSLPINRQVQTQSQSIYLVIVVVVVVVLALIIIGIIFWMKKTNIISKFYKTSRKFGETSIQVFDTLFQLRTKDQVNLPSNEETNIDTPIDEDEFNAFNQTHKTSIEVEERKYENLNPALTQDDIFHHREYAKYVNQSAVDNEKQSCKNNPKTPYEILW